MPLLSLERVSKRFNAVAAVNEVSFTVNRGEVVGFLGPNGAGKSTTMRLITQHYEPDAGDIRLDGIPIAEAGREAKRRIGFLPENNPLYPEMFASEFLEFAARLRDPRSSTVARRGAVDEAVAATGLEPVYNRPIGELSKGYRQRVGLAAAILHRPDLLVLDEPTEGLDPNQRVEIRRLIADLGRERTVILSTHVLSEVQHTCSRAIIINRGRVVADGAVETLVSRAGEGVRVSVEARGDNIEPALSALAGVRSLERHDAADGRVRVSVHASGSADIRPQIFDLARNAGWTLYELHQETGTLEDLFRDLTAADRPADVPPAPNPEVAA